MRTRCGDVGDPLLSRKASSDVCVRPVPETDTGGQVENTKATGELWLRNSAKCPRNFGRRGTTAGDRLVLSWWWSQRIEGSDCLLKTQVRAKTVSRCIRTDACPVLEG